jgi:hypothetical protein
VDPPLRVREDWWVFERPFFNGKEGRVDFRKNLRFKGGLVGFRRSFKVQGRTGRFSKSQLYQKRKNNL